LRYRVPANSALQWLSFHAQGFERRGEQTPPAVDDKDSRGPLFAKRPISDGSDFTPPSASTARPHEFDYGSHCKCCMLPMLSVIEILNRLSLRALTAIVQTRTMIQLRPGVSSAEADIANFVARPCLQSGACPRANAQHFARRIGTCGTRLYINRRLRLVERDRKWFKEVRAPAGSSCVRKQPILGDKPV